MLGVTAHFAILSSSMAKSQNNPNSLSSRNGTKNICKVSRLLSGLTPHTTDVLTISLHYIMMQCKKNIVPVINCVLHLTLLARIFLKRTNRLH